VAVMGVDRSDVDADVDEADEATSTQIVLEADVASIPAKPPGRGKASEVSILPCPLFPVEADIPPCPADVSFVPEADIGRRLADRGHDKLRCEEQSGSVRGRHGLDDEALFLCSLHWPAIIDPGRPLITISPFIISSMMSATFISRLVCPHQHLARAGKERR